MDTRIRPALFQDAAALAELAARTFEETFAADNNPEDLALHLAQAFGPVQQALEIADPDITTLLVDVDGTLAGFAQLREGPAPECVTGDAPIELLRFYLGRECHGQGIAQTLMRSVDETARLAESRTLWLGVWERNERAKAFYRKCQFVDVGSHVFMVGNDPQTDRIFVRPVE